MSIFINKDTTVITQGITGKTGQFLTDKCQEYYIGIYLFVGVVKEFIFGLRFFVFAL